MSQAASWLAILFGSAPAPTGGAACTKMDFNHAGYVACSFDLKRDEMRLYLRDDSGRPYTNFGKLSEDLAAHGRKLVFAMNAGMFEEDLSPVGLYVEDGKRLKKADTRGGATNFHLKPNGVFWISDHAAGVTETSRFLAEPPPVRHATQSGPMMVIDGRIHPRIQPTGASAKIRNGVCVRGGANVVFAISDGPVTFHEFATLFRDGLKCNDALFLDGSVSSLYAPELSRDDELEDLGPMVGVTVAR